MNEVNKLIEVVSKMPGYQKRVVVEKIQLDEKRSNLKVFIASDSFGALDNAEQARLMRQHSTMHVYSDVLAERIATF